MESDITVSVIVVTYNQEDTIGRTLDHILSQQTGGIRFEIIIGDDASTDGTESVCHRYAEAFPDRIVYVRRSVNMGVTANYFDCIARARGRYLADCAGDDFWTDDTRLRRQVEILDADPGVSLVATDWVCRDEATGGLSRHPRNPEQRHVARFGRGELLEPLITGARVLHLCTALYRKDVIDRAVAAHPDIFVDPGYSCEDQQILLALNSAGDVVILPGVTLCYSVGHESLSHQVGAAKRFEYSLRALRQSLRLQKFFGLEGRHVARTNAERVNHIAAMALRAGVQPEIPRLASRAARFRRFVKRKNLYLPPKARIYSAVMRVPALWKIVNRLRSALGQ